MMTTTKSTGSLKIILTLAAILVFGFFLRAYNLSEGSVWIDELWHISAAQSMIETGQPTLPSGGTYTRALPFTAMVMLSIKAFGLNEISVRLPALLFGMFSILLTFFVMRSWYGTRAGLMAAFLIAFGPLCVYWARECRMYSLFQFLYLGIAYFSYECFEGPKERKLVTRVFFGGCTGIFFVISYFTHPLTQFFIPSFGLYFLIMLILSLSGMKDELISKKKYVILMLLGIIGATAVLVLKGNKLIPEFLEAAAYMPQWAIPLNEPFYYKWMLEDWYPVLFVSFPLAVLIAMLLDLRKGVYLTCLFIVPFALHSFVFAWKAERYLLYVFQFFLMIFAPMLATAVTGSVTWIHKNVKERWDEGLGRLLAMLIYPAFILLMVPIVLHPALKRNIQYITQERWPAWKKVYAEYDDLIHPADLVIATEPISLKFYGMKNSLWKLNNFSLEESVLIQTNEGEKRVDRASAEGLVTSLEDLQRVFQDNPGQDVWFLLVSYEFDEEDAVPADLRQYLVENVQWYLKGEPVSFDKVGSLNGSEIRVGKISRASEVPER